MIRLRSLAKGMGSFAVPSLRTFHQESGTIAADHCYTIFLRHYTLIAPYLGERTSPVPPRVAELGPGSSVGTGLASLLSGAEHYTALDLIDHLDSETNVEVPDGLVELFQAKTEIPCSGPHFSRVFPMPRHEHFPDELVEQVTALSEERLLAIKQCLLGQKVDGPVRVVAPWTSVDNMERESLDWVWSHSVMEHIDPIEEAYRCLFEWLKPGAFATHLIGYGSHGLTSNMEWSLDAR